MPKARSTIRTPGLIALGALMLVVASGCKTEEARKLPPDFLDKAVKLYSQNDEEKLIRHFFDDMEDGFFLDVGCAEWQKDSTTLYLEEKLGWTGIAIDARAELAKEWAEHRPGAKFFNFIVTDHAGTKDKFYAAGRVSSTDPEHIHSFPKGKDVDVSKLEREVPTVTLNQLLDEQGVKKVDFMLLDIELGEPPALRGFDIERFKPELICIEAGNQKVRDFIAPYFAEHHYERIEEYLQYDKVNWYYKPSAAR
jgi:FkbM family methyltransferase